MSRAVCLRSLAAVGAIGFAFFSCAKGAPPADLVSSASASNSAYGASSGAASVASSLADNQAAASASTSAGIDELQERAKRLFEAIVKDQPDLAMDFFYPREPFLALKDVANPGAYWDKLVGEYKQKIHADHKKLGKKAADCEFANFELNTAKQIYKNPKTEYNKLGYNKIPGSKLHYKCKGKISSLTVAVVIDYEQKWFITHL